MTPVGSDEKDPGRALTLFAVLYAVAALVETFEAVIRFQHVTNPVTLSQTLCFIAALWLLLRPGSLARFLTFCGIHAVMIFTILPRTPNHWLLGFVVDLSFLLTFLRLKLAVRGNTVSRQDFYGVSAPLVRLALLALYFWAVFHKLNVDFFDRDISCGTSQIFRMKLLFPFLPVDAWAREAVIYGTLALEGAIPVLLALRRTRTLGLLVAVVFHMVLGFLYTGFSATLFAYFALFANRDLLASVPDGATLRRRFAPGLLAFAATYVLLVYGFEVRLQALGVLWMLYGFGWIAVLIPSVWPLSDSETPCAPAFAVPHKILLVLPALVFLNGLNPYLGLKNVQSFSMFSNLKTAGGTSNHLLVPASWQVADFQNDLVTILSSSDSVLAELTEARRYIHFFSTTVHPSGHPALDLPPPRFQLPYAALRARVKHYKREGRSDLDIRYERGGEIHEIHRAEQDPELANFPYLLEKFFLLRAVPVGDRGLCMW